MKLLLIAGARPNFMKISPIVRALQARDGKPGVRIGWKIVHTGQHYDDDMSQIFFDELGIPEPDYHLGAGSASHAEQTARIMVEFEKVCLAESPYLIVVVGDVNSTLACSVVAKKLGIRVAHVEAGLRSGDMTMPEEINRIVTDSISDYFFVTEQSGIDNLKREGKREECIHFVGHVMVDNLLYQVNELALLDKSVFPNSALKERLGKYIFLTLHRPSNVDDETTLRGIVEALNEISRNVPIVFPMHPRTRKQMHRFGLAFEETVHVFPPMGFRESLQLWKDAILVMTDSGGLQEETTALGVPCITLRENTERPITVECGTNVIAGNRKENILRVFQEVKNGGPLEYRVPPLWDGHAAERIVDVFLSGMC